MPRVEVRHMVQGGRHRAGLFLDYPTSEHDVTGEQLAELQKDFRLHVSEVAAVVVGREDASSANVASADPPKPGPLPGESTPGDDLPKTPDEREDVKSAHQKKK